MTFKQLSSIAFTSWTYEQAVWIKQNDKRKLIKKIANYVIKKKYEKNHPTPVDCNGLF